MAATDWASSCSPHPNSQSPPIAHAPNPTGVMKRSEFPRTLVSIAFYQHWNLGQVQARRRKGLGHRRLGTWPCRKYRLEAYATLISRLRRSKAGDSQSRMLNEF